VVTQLSNEDRVVFYLVNNQVFAVDPARPPSRKVVPERFGFSCSLIPVALDISDKLADTTEDFRIVFLPEEVVIPGVLRNPILSSLDITICDFQFPNYALES
jgi:hypothetical protein